MSDITNTTEDQHDFNLMIETLRERITDDREAQNYVNYHAHKNLKHFMSSTGLDLPIQVREELICQYQVQLWSKILTSISKAF